MGSLSLGSLVFGRLVGPFLLAAFFSLALRSLLLALLDRRGGMVTIMRILAALLFASFGSAYALLELPLVVWDAPALALATLTALLPFVGIAVQRRVPTPGLGAGLLLLMLLGSLVALSVLNQLPAGFLRLTEDRPVLLVELTGDTRPQMVRWSPPSQPPREESLQTHRVIFRTPEGAEVAEAWIYGDQVAVKGRVLRLSPFLNAAGVPNLFELIFAHNGYATAERHNDYPHAAVPLPCGGPLAVASWWRPLQARLLESWEKSTSDTSGWMVRSATTESTYFPLEDVDGKPVRGTFRLVLTPGGLTAG